MPLEACLRDCSSACSFPPLGKRIDVQSLGRLRSKGGAPADASCEPPLYGLIQHSFALQRLVVRGNRLRGRTNRERVSELFDANDFRVREAGEIHRPKPDHSPLARGQLTTLRSLKAMYVHPDSPTKPQLPEAFRWADWGWGADRYEYEEPKLIFADEFDREGLFSISDFLVTDGTRFDAGDPISQLLLEVMAHKRSRLFGFALANRFVNVMLPCAIIEPTNPGSGAGAPPPGAWAVLPLLSFVRGGRVRSRLRSTYSLTLFLVPVSQSEGLLGHRPVSIDEIVGVVNPGWGFAASPPVGLDEFKVSGDLIEYLVQLTGFDLESMLSQPDGTANLRALIETIAFGVGLGVAPGAAAPHRRGHRKLIGDDVVTSLGSARVSSVVLSDPTLEPDKVKEPVRQRPFPGVLAKLLPLLSGTIRIPEDRDKRAFKCRLDRPNVDNDIYAVGVLPTKRVIVVASCAESQYGIRESALMQAGSIAYMTLGAATAIGTMREIDRRLEHLEGASDPKEIATIDAEIASDLGEIYDLDITRESYRAIYQRLRDQLGITRDYRTLQDKMQALYRATTTFHEQKSERRLEWLTAAIVALSILILIGTIIVAGKPGA